MKKIAVIILVCFCISMCLTSGLMPKADEEHILPEGAALFVLPASLEEIGASAFESTGAEKIIIPDSTDIIGDSAFAHNINLRFVLIPKSVTYIGDQAFEGISCLTIQGEENSYAIKWARDHNVNYIQTESALVHIMRLGKQLNVLFSVLYALADICLASRLWKRRIVVDVWRSMRPQDRPELYPINYRFP